MTEQAEIAAIRLAAAAEQPHVASVVPAVVCGALRLFDFGWTSLSALLSLYCYDLVNPGNRFDPIFICLIGIVAAFSGTTVFGALGLYDFSRFALLGWELNRLLFAWTGIILGGVLAAFLTKTSASYSRIWLVAWLMLGGAGLAAARFVLARLVGLWSARGRLQRRVAVIGSGAEAARLIADIRAQGVVPVHVAGVFDDRALRRPAQVNGVRVLGGVDALLAFARASVVDEVIIALPCAAAQRIAELAGRLRTLPIDLRLWIDLPVRQIGVRGFEWRDGIPAAALADRPLKSWSALQKRIEDVCLSSFLLVLSAPLMVIIAAAIKLDSAGPVVFRQKRFGFNNEIIQVLKFRTMFVDRADPEGALQARADDPRVTRVGRWLRRTSMDELPQLLNVMEGSMSLVGPRPHPLAMQAAGRLYHDAVDGYFARHRVRPGITGLAQVSGCRGETDTVEKAQKRIQLDLEYIDRWSLALDFKIIARTIAHLRDPRAY